jgi:hypothetical protein
MSKLSGWVKWTIAGLFALVMVSHIASILFEKDDFTKSTEQLGDQAIDSLKKVQDAADLAARSCRENPACENAGK